MISLFHNRTGLTCSQKNPQLPLDQYIACKLVEKQREWTTYPVSKLPLHHWTVMQTTLSRFLYLWLIGLKRIFAWNVLNCSLFLANSHRDSWSNKDFKVSSNKDPTKHNDRRKAFVLFFIIRAGQRAVSFRSYSTLYYNTNERYLSLNEWKLASLCHCLQIRGGDAANEMPQVHSWCLCVRGWKYNFVVFLLVEKHLDSPQMGEWPEKGCRKKQGRS